MAYEECTVVGRNAVLEAYRSGKTIDKLFILDGCQDRWSGQSFVRPEKGTH